MNTGSVGVLVVVVVEIVVYPIIDPSIVDVVLCLRIADLRNVESSYSV